MRTKIKICGVCDLETALFTEKCGADSLGFVFASKSKRFIEPQKAKHIIENLPPFVTSVALFANNNEEEINNVLKNIKIDLIQFHGNENEGFCKQFNKKYIKAIKVKNRDSLLEISSFPSANGFLLDTFISGEIGGTGKAFDWNILNNFDTSKIILAGGLKIDNVQEAIKKIAPYAVDVSSSVEKEGTKDKKLIQKFINKVQNVDFQSSNNQNEYYIY